MTQKLVKYRSKKKQKKKYTRKSFKKHQGGGINKQVSRKNKESARKAKQKGGKAKKNIKKPNKNNLMKTLDNEFSSGFFVIDTGLGRSAQPNRIKKLENIFFQRESEKNNTPEEKLSSVKVKPQQQNTGETLMGAISKGLTEGRQARSQVQTALSTARSSIDSITSGLGVPEARISDSMSGIGKQMGQIFDASKGKRTQPRSQPRIQPSPQPLSSSKKNPIPSSGQEKRIPKKKRRGAFSEPSPEAKITPDPMSPDPRTPEPITPVPRTTPEPITKPDAKKTPTEILPTANKSKEIETPNIPYPECPCCKLPLNDPNGLICGKNPLDPDECLYKFLKEKAVKEIEDIEGEDKKLIHVNTQLTNKVMDRLRKELFPPKEKKKRDNLNL